MGGASGEVGLMVVRLHCQGLVVKLMCLSVGQRRHTDFQS